MSFGCTDVLVPENPRSQSFCQRLETGGLLGTSFFFKRGHLSRGNAKRLFATITYQLALVLPDFKRAIAQRVKEYPSVIERSLPTQQQRLIGSQGLVID
jgi:hypothetical protein